MRFSYDHDLQRGWQAKCLVLAKIYKYDGGHQVDIVADRDWKEVVTGWGVEMSVQPPRRWYGPCPCPSLLHDLNRNVLPSDSVLVLVLVPVTTFPTVASGKAWNDA